MSHPTHRRNARPSYHTRGTVSECRRIDRDVRAPCGLASVRGEKVNNDSGSLSIIASGMQAVKEHRGIFSIDYSVVFSKISTNNIYDTHI